MCARVKSNDNGHTYVVDQGPDGNTRVFVEIHRSPVSRFGTYQVDMVLRRIKAGSRNYKHAVAKAARGETVAA